MISKNIQFIAAFFMTLSIGANASQPVQSKPVVPSSKTEASSQNGGTYADEVEIIKFDEYTGRDSFAIPVDEEALEQKEESNQAKTR